MPFFRPTYAEIDLASVVHNFHQVEKLLPENGRVLAMVKADAYGHGAVRVSRELEKAGAEAFGVATVEEGLELKESGVRRPIVIMGGLMSMGSSVSEKIVEAGFTPVVHSAEVVRLLDKACKKRDKKVNIHLKIDTGMSRLGIRPANVDGILNAIRESSFLSFEGVMTHFAEAEDAEYTEYQISIFSDIYQKIRKEFGNVPVWHMPNSAAIIDRRILLNSEIGQAWVRPGLMLYGATPSPKYKKRVDLKPVMSLKSSVVLIKNVPEGTPVSYGLTYTTKRRSRLGIVPIGYADGYPWALSNKGEVLVGGLRVPVVGRVTMDMIIIDLTDSSARLRDEVVLLGRQGDEKIEVDELAERAETISYEFFCGISKRMPRIYKNQRE